LVQLGPIGTPEAKELNDTIGRYIPKLVEMFEKDMLLPSPYDEVGKGGFEDAIDALRYQKNGAGGANKVVVQIQPVENDVDFLV
jgi:hypothetical protein